MIKEVTPELTVNDDVLTFLIGPVRGNYKLYIDEKNPGITFIIQRSKAVGISYQKDASDLFRQYENELNQLCKLAKEAPQSNRLAPYVWWAWFHRILWDMQCEGAYKDPEIAALNDDYIIKLPPDMVEEKSGGNPTPPSSLEEAGIIGFFDSIRPDIRYTVIFENTLGYEIRGIDAILKDHQTGELIVVELKGTSRPIRSALSYLKRTKTKGRQMSWEWIFRSLLGVHKAMASSAVFLHFLEPFFAQKIKRWLVITRSVKEQGHWSNKEIKIYDEEVLSGIGTLNDRFREAELKEFYTELQGMGLCNY